MTNKKLYSIQEWLPYEKILKRGIIKLKNNSYIKILKVIPINFNLKSNLEKEAILNSYKTFLKTCNFDIQILIQSNSENLSNQISILNKQLNKEKNNNIKSYINNYINYINYFNQEKNSSTKHFFILIKNSVEKNKKDNIEEIIKEDLNEKFFIIKDTLSRCGNFVQEISEDNEIETIIKNYFIKKL